jgi:DNA-binding MltR family transcriptional regulator
VGNFKVGKYLDLQHYVKAVDYMKSDEEKYVYRDKTSIRFVSKMLF